MKGEKIEVLIVDDIECFRRDICRKVNSYERLVAVPAKSARGAIDLLNRLKIQAAIIDYTLPDPSERERFESHELTLMQQYMSGNILKNPELAEKLIREASSYRRGREVVEYARAISKTIPIAVIASSDDSVVLAETKPFSVQIYEREDLAEAVSYINTLLKLVGGKGH